MNLTPDDILRIRSEATLAHDKAKLTLSRDSTADFEQQRDDCEEKKNATITVINFCEDQLETFRKQKRAIDDQMADVRSLQREFESLKAELTQDAKRLNNAFWDVKRGTFRLSPKPE
jgi:peptidoglycan hydrolase CwlO-like protein